MKPNERTVLGVLSALAATAAACTAEVALPESPREAQVSMVAAIYDNPTGTIDVANLESQIDAIQARVEELHLDWLPPLVAEALERLSERLGDASLTPETEDGAETAKHTIIDAVAYMKRVCRGWSDSPAAPDEATNGFMELTAVIEDNSLREDVWGGATGCKTRLDPLDDVLGGLTITPSPSVNLSLEGTLDVRLYGPLPRTFGDAKFLLIFSGRLGTDDRTADASFDFRVLDGQLAFRYAVSDGDVIVELGATSISVRGSNGTFTCDLASRSCQ